MAERERDQSGDPYEADSDHEYEPLEADGIGEGDRVEDLAMRTRERVDGEPERAYPPAEETERQERELKRMLDESINRDPETLAADQARRHSDDPLGDLSPEARRLFDRTTEIHAEDLDDEDLAP